MNKIDIKDNWVIITSLFVALFSIIGFVYSSFYYSEFGISYLNHAETSDLFFVVFVHPWFFFSFLVFIAGFFLISSLHEIKYKNKVLKYENIWLLGKLYKYRLVVLTFFILIGFLFISYSIVVDRITNIRKFNYPIHQVEYNRNDILKCVVSIGSTSTTLFYWDVNLLRAVIIPKKQIVKVTVVLPDPPPLEQLKRRPKPRKNGEYQKALDLWAKKIEEKCHLGS